MFTWTSKQKAICFATSDALVCTIHILLFTILTGCSCLRFIDGVHRVTIQLSWPLACSTIIRAGYTLQRLLRLALWVPNFYCSSFFPQFLAEVPSVACRAGRHHVQLLGWEIISRIAIDRESIKLISTCIFFND